MIKKIIHFLLSVKYIILTFLLLTSCLMLPPPKSIKYKIIDSIDKGKCFLVLPTYSYNYIIKTLSSTITIINISNENKELKPYEIVYKSNKYNICFDSLVIVQRRNNQFFFHTANDIVIPPKDTIKIQMLCSKNNSQDVYFEQDTVNLSIQIQNDFFKYRFIPIRE